jgi:hypothetical protein
MVLYQSILENKDRFMKFSYLILLVLVLVVASCATLPPKEANDQAVVVISTEIVQMEKTIPDIYAALELQNGELIPLEHGYNFISVSTNSLFYLKAYIAREDRRQDREEWGEIIELDQKFNLQDGIIYVFPYQVKFYPAARPGRISLGRDEPMVRLGGRIAELSEEDMEWLLEDIANQDNYIDWKEIKIIGPEELVD